MPVVSLLVVSEIERKLWKKWVHKDGLEMGLEGPFGMWEGLSYLAMQEESSGYFAHIKPHSSFKWISFPSSFLQEKQLTLSCIKNIYLRVECVISPVLALALCNLALVDLMILTPPIPQGSALEIHFNSHCCWRVREEEGQKHFPAVLGRFAADLQHHAAAVRC